MLAMLLKAQGFSTRVAHDGPDAILAALAFHPRVVFLDIGLPEMDGYEVCRQLRANPQMADTTFVALTGWGGEEDKKRGRIAGFAFHLAKPIDLAQLICGKRFAEPKSLRGPSGLRIAPETVSGRQT